MLLFVGCSFILSATGPYPTVSLLLFEDKQNLNQFWIDNASAQVSQREKIYAFPPASLSQSGTDSTTMPPTRSQTVSKIPLIINQLLHWGSRDQPTDDDGQGLLENDSLSIPLRDQHHDLGQPIRRELLPHHNSHHPLKSKALELEHLKRLVSQLPCLSQHKKSCLVGAMVALILLLTLLGTRVESVQAIQGLLLCGSQRYSVTNVSRYKSRLFY
jgi:hypothetical protein